MKFVNCNFYLKDENERCKKVIKFVNDLMIPIEQEHLFDYDTRCRLNEIFKIIISICRGEEDDKNISSK